MSEKKQKTYIIDGSSFLYRAYYSLPTLTTREGIPVGAVYGFARMIKKVIDTYTPDMMVLVWDSKGPTKRHEIYQEYKQSRQAAPGDLSFQKNLIKKFADLIGVRQLALEGIEADDLMYSFAKKLEAQNMHSVMITSDKDMHQTLSNYVTMFDPFKDKIITVESAEEKYGFPLEKLPFYYGLTGDTSDNIPGVRSIGPKTATKLVIQFESLDDLYTNLDAVSAPRIRHLLETGKDSAYLSQKLFRLRTYETYLTVNDCQFSPELWDNAYPLFKELDFTTLLKTVKHPPEEAPLGHACDLAKKYSFKTIRTIDELKTVIAQLKKEGRCALDTEGTELDPLRSDLVGLSLCYQEGTAYYLPLKHKTEDEQVSIEEARPVLTPLFEDPAIAKYLHHAKYDALLLWQHGFSLRGVAFDTLVAASLLVKDGQRKGLKHLSEYYLCEPMIHFADVVKKKKYKNFSYVPLAEATEYAAADAHQTYRLYILFKKQLEEEKLDTLFYELEMPLLTVLLDMEYTGIKLDQTVIKNINQHVSCELEKIRTQVIDFVGHEYASINLNSPKQIEDLLFNKLELPPIKKTAQKTGYSTDHQVLYELSKIHPVPEMIIQYRELYKLKSTYLDTLGTYINTHTHRIHTTFSQTIVATDRLSLQFFAQFTEHTK